MVIFFFKCKMATWQLCKSYDDNNNDNDDDNSNNKQQQC